VPPPPLPPPLVVDLQAANWVATITTTINKYRILFLSISSSNGILSGLVMGERVIQEKSVWAMDLLSKHKTTHIGLHKARAVPAPGATT
jgi:hypothetical protein